MSSDRANASYQRRQYIESELNDSHYACKSAYTPDEFRSAKDWLTKILDLLSDKTQRMLHDDHQACWERRKEVQETLKWRRKEITDFHYGKYSGEAYEAKGLADSDPKATRDMVRRIQSDMRGKTMDRWESDEVRKILDEAWSIASAASDRRKYDWEQRHSEGQNRLRDSKSNKLGSIEFKRGQIYNLETQIDKCRDMLYGASDNYRRKVEGWIDEHHAKIRDLHDQIAALEEKIRDIDSKLD